jgi:hypothetical protein
MIYSLLFFIFVLSCFLGLELFYKAPYKLERFLLLSQVIIPPFILLLLFNNFFSKEKLNNSSHEILLSIGLFLLVFSFVFGLRKLITEYRVLTKDFSKKENS